MTESTIEADVRRYREAAEIVLSMEHLATWQPEDKHERVAFYDEAMDRFAEVAEGYDWGSPVAVTQAYIILSRANLDDDGLALFFALIDHGTTSEEQAGRCIDETLGIADGYDWNPDIRSGLYVQAIKTAVKHGMMERAKRGVLSMTGALGDPTLDTDPCTQCMTMHMGALAMTNDAEAMTARRRSPPRSTRRRSTWP